MGDVLQEAVNEANRKIVADHQLKIAVEPKLDFPGGQEEVERALAAEGDLAFTVTFETLPKFEVGSFDDRFELIINKSIVLNIDDVRTTTEDVILSYDRNQINVKTTKGSIISSIKAYDIIGKNVLEKTPHKSDFYIDTSNLNKGMVLIINVILENSQTLSKKIILH